MEALKRFWDKASHNRLVIAIVSAVVGSIVTQFIVS